MFGLKMKKKKRDKMKGKNRDFMPINSNIEGMIIRQIREPHEVFPIKRIAAKEGYEATVDFLGVYEHFVSYSAYLGDAKINLRIKGPNGIDISFEKINPEGFIGMGWDNLKLYDLKSIITGRFNVQIDEEVLYEVVKAAVSPYIKSVEIFWDAKFLDAVSIES